MEDTFQEWKREYVSLDDRSEVWVPSSVFPLLEVSSLGRVRQKGSKQLVVPWMSRHGRLVVTSHSKSKNLSFLVASEFVSNQEAQKYVKYRDGNVLNNRHDNLFWSDTKHTRTRSVYCVETGTVFNSLWDLSQALRWNSGKVYQFVERGKPIRGLHYEFVCPDNIRNEHNGVTVVCLETGAVYDSMAEAAKSLSVSKYQVESSVHTGRKYKYSFKALI